MVNYFNILLFAEVFILISSILLAVRTSFNKNIPLNEKLAFLGLLSTMFLWMVSAFAFNFVSEISNDNFLHIARSGWAWPPLVLATLINFYLVKFKITTLKWNLVRGILFIIAISLSIANFFTSYVIKSVNPNTVKLEYGSGYLNNVAFIFTIIALVVFLNQIIRKKLNAKDKTRLNYLTLGYQSTAVLAVISNVIIPTLLNSSRYSHLVIFTEIPTLLVSYYVLVQNRFYDINYVKRIIRNYLVFNLVLVGSYYSSFFFAEKSGIDILSFQSFLYGQVIVIVLFFIFYKTYIKKYHKSSYQEGFYRFTLTHSEGNDTILIKTLLHLFKENLENKYNIKRCYIALISDDSQNIIGKKIKRKPLYRDTKNLNEDYRYTFYLRIYEKRDGTDLSVQEVENIRKDTKELIHLIVHSILYENSLSFTKILQREIRKATATLLKQKEEIQEKYQYEKDMVGIMGHELRTPMTVAKGFIELMIKAAKNGTASPEYIIEKAVKVHDSILKEAEIIETMLSTSHVENNKISLQIQEVDILKVLDYAYDAFDKSAYVNGLKLYYNKPNFEIPKITTDHNRLQEVINNLVSNAVKYTKEGRIDIDVELDKEFVYIHVKDTGIGIPAHEIENLGKKFYRLNQYLDSKDRVRPGGTGLGLYVTKGLLRALKGELLVESELGKGSRFTVKLPIKPQFEPSMDIVFMGSMQNEADLFAKMGLQPNSNI